MPISPKPIRRGQSLGASDFAAGKEPLPRIRLKTSRLNAASPETQKSTCILFRPLSIRLDTEAVDPQRKMVIAANK